MENKQRQNPELLEIINAQTELLRISLYISTQGPTTYAGEELKCNLNETKLKTSQLIAMSAGQSVNTILKCTEWKGIPVRDLYPVARSAIESFINAAFLLVEDDSVAQRAERYVAFKAWKQLNRKVGSGDFSLHISMPQSDKNAIPSKFAEFDGRGNEGWTKLDLSSRFRRVGELAGKKAGSRLLAAYSLIYSLSSEIIHGSPYGVNYFYQAHLPANPTVEDFQISTTKQVEDLLVAISHAMAGYLAAFFKFQGMSAPYIAEQELFNRLLKLESVEPQEIERLERKTTL